MTSAPEAVWRNGAWELADARVERLILSPSGAESVAAASEAEGTTLRISTDLDPASLLLRRYASFSQSLSWRQISAMLKSPRLDPAMRQRLERARWSRVSNALSTYLTLVITLPFFLVREPRNMLVQSLKCAPIGIFALLGSVFGAAVDVPGLPVQVSVFLPVLILIPIAIAAWSSVKT